PCVSPAAQHPDLRLLTLVARRVRLRKSLDEPLMTTSQLPDFNKNIKCANFQEITRHYLGNSYLTKREIECIKWSIHGKSAEEIAVIVNISRRTVETHLENIKIKFNCYNKFQLGYIIGQLGINIENL
ncbi:MAG: helix-turn-helix transcriptional regulator, partial [Gammaproteobacteria bacterium]|nr:helix-turn-helix transcriptional regulator [Gammaproteobacteria bacterium]